MNEQYKAWIEANVPTRELAYGNCFSVTLNMQEAFPELRQVSGFYFDALWGRRTHWWLQTQDGQVVDPTARQFPTKGSGEYQEVVDTSEIPTGVCKHCGCDVYNHDTFCSERCEAATANYIRSGVL